MVSKNDVAQSMPQLYRVAEGLYFGRVYWVVGDLPSSSRQRNEVRSPPNAGWSHCLLIDKGGKLVTLFCPYTLEAFQVSRSSLEVQSMEIDPKYVPLEKVPGLRQQDGFLPWTSERQKALLARILSAWEVSGRLTLPGRDYDTAALVISIMGGSVPLRVAESTELDKPRGGKEADILGLLKPVKRNSKRGKVLQFFIAQPRSIREAMAEFGTSRSNVLSHLFILQKDHGIGYVLMGDAASISLPAGCSDPFEGEA